MLGRLETNGAKHTPTKSPARVAMVHTVMPKFRRGFHSALRSELADRDIELIVVHGQPEGTTISHQATTNLDWARVVNNRTLRAGSKELVWQPYLRMAKDADMVIVLQQSKLLANYILFVQQLLGRQRLALFGHGRNFDDETPSRLGESVKRLMSRHVHWWFAYNDLSARIVRDLGFPPERITSVLNAIDTEGLQSAYEAVSDDQLQALRERLGLKATNLCVYTGGMYDLKRLPYLLEACLHIRRLIPDFEMVFIGGGPDSQVVEEAAAAHQWLHAVGPLFHEDKVAYFKLAKLLLMPGRVGLVVLDAFALQTPLVTVDSPRHAPEVDYLVDRQNGVVLPAGTDPATYAEHVAQLLRDEHRRSALIEGGLKAASTYTAENMVARFAAGIEAALRTSLKTPLRVP